MTIAMCPSPHELERLFLGGLSDDDAEALEHHVLGCTACRQRLDVLLRSKDTLARALNTGTDDDSAWASPAVADLVRKLKSLQSLLAHDAVAARPDETHAVAPTPPHGGPASQPSVPNAGDAPTHPPSPMPDITIDVKPAGPDASLVDFLAPPQAANELGRLGQYRILKILGHGGMGVVYQGEDTKLKRTVAIKAMLPALAASASSSKRFMREAEAMAAVEHDHIVRIYQVDDERGIPFMAMEFLKGESLDERLKRDEPFAVAEILRIGREVAEGLSAAHSQGLIHRDIKPGNVWLEAPRARVKILDFGLARASSQEAGLTQQGAIIGTPAYMAPEQGRGSQVDARCDLFSLGVILYRLCTGKLPFIGNDTVSTLMAVAMTEPAPPIEVNPEMPRALSDLVMKLLEKDPLERMATAAEVVQVIQEIAKRIRLGQSSDDQTEVLTTRRIPARHPISVKSHVAPEKKSGRLAGPACLLIALGVAAIVGVVGLLGAGGFYYIVTDKGTIEIATEDEGVQVVILKNGKQVDIVNPKTNKTWRLDTGAYTLKLKDDPDGFEIALPADQKFELKRGDTVAVTIRRKARERAAVVKLGELRVTQPALGWARSVAFAPNGKLVACGTQDGQILLWDPWTGEHVARWPAHDGWVNSVAFTPDSNGLLSAGEDKIVRLWNVATRKEDRQFNGHTGSVGAVAVSRDGKRLLSGSDDRTIRLWDLATGNQLKSLTGHTAGIFGVAFSRDGRQALSGSADKTMRLWDLEKGATLHVFQYGMGYVMGVAFLPDGKRGLCVSHDNFIHLWDLEKGRELVRAPSGPCNGLAVSPDGTRVVAGGFGKRDLILWMIDGPTLRELTRLPGHTDVIEKVAYAPDGLHVVSGSRDKTLRLWRLPDPPAPKQQPAPEAGWVPLFNGKDLTGWEPIGPAQWTVRDGLLCTERGPGRGWLASKRDYANFELELQYRLAAGTNSGVFLRAWKEGELNGGQFMEIQIIDDQAAGTLGKDNGTAALFGVVPARPAVQSLPGTWHNLAIRAQGRRVQVVHDGKKVVEANLDDHAAAFQRFPGLTKKSGRIGLQNYGSQIEFKDLRIKELPAVE